MSERLRSKLDNWIKHISGELIELDELRSVVFSNKDFRTEGQIKMAIEYLQSKGYVIKDSKAEVKEVQPIQETTETEDFVDIFEDTEDSAEEEIDIELFNEILEEDEEKLEAEIEEELESLEEDSSGNIGRYSTIGLYFRDVDKFDTSVLTQDEERELSRKAQSGDEEAYLSLLGHNLRLVISIARRYASGAALGVLSMEDLIQEGNIGLLQAIDRFNPDLGYKFSTYATWWIRQRITRTLFNDSRTIRLPIHLIELVMAIKKVQSLYFDENNDYPDNQYIADFINTHDLLKSHHRKRKLRADEISSAMNYWDNQSLVSLSKPVGDEEDSMLGDFIPSTLLEPNEEVERSFLAADLYDAMDNVLEKKEIIVLRLRYGLNSEHKPYTLNECGKFLGMTGERVRQLEARAIKKLRKKYPKMDGYDIR